MHPYVAQQPDELTLELADILNILDKTEDGEAGRGHCAHARPRDPAPGPHTSLRKRRGSSAPGGSSQQSLMPGCGTQVPAHLRSPRLLCPSWLPRAEGSFSL